MTKSFFLSCCFLIATTSALAQQFPMDQFMGVNLRREDPVERLNCVGFVREYHDWAIDENNSYNFRRVDSLAFPNNLYSWNLQQSTSVKFDNFYSDMLFHLNHQPGTRPPICATMKQCLPYLAGGDTYGTYSELKPVKYDSSGRRKRDQYPQNDKPLNYTPVLGWGNTASYTWIADWLYQFTRRYGANVSPLSNIAKPQTGEADKKGLNLVGYVELWNEPNKYWIKNYGDATDVSWLRATQFTGGEYAAMASTSYDAHRTTIDLTDSVTRLHYKPGVRSADNSMKFVMGGSAGIREYDWRFLQDMKTWFDNNRIDTGLRTKYPFDVINFHHYNSNRWFGLVGQVGLNDYAASPEEDRWRLGSREVNYDAATTATGTAFEQEDSIRHYDMVNPVNSSTRTFKQRLVELRYRVDSLFGRRPVELWMSEFGFDTNEKSPYKVPTIYHPNGSGAVLIDQQEMQARFIVRTYLEIAAAKWDRAMQYDFRDEVSYNGSLFQASGLLRDRANNYTPKKSYYYVHTMKEALKGTKFRNEIKVGNDPTFTTDPIFGGHSYWYKDTSYHRLMRFTKNNPSVTNGGDIVYVAWLPTKTNAIKQDSVKIYLQPSDNAATLATIVSMSVGDINGLRKPFILREDAVGKYMVLKLTISNIWNCIFDGNFRDLKVPQSDFDRRRSFTGLDLHYVNPTFGGGSIPNLFNDLAEGVKSNYSNVTLNNPIFKNIQPKKQLSYTSTATVAPMGGIAVSTTNGSLTFNGGGRDVPIFENVYNGFYCHYSDFNISNGHFVTEGNYALQSYYGRGGSAIFDNNRVITLEGGALGIWKGSGTIALLNNNIDCGASNRSVAAVAVGSYFHRDISLTSPINTSIEMHSDTIRGTGGVRSTILAVDMAEDVMVRRNLLKFNAYSSADATPSWGIKMDLVERSDIRWNDIIGIKNLNDDYRYSPAQVGILSSNSRNNAIQCDSIANAKISLQFQYNNTSIRNNSAGEVAGNKLSGYNIGLKVDSFAIVGIQSHRRNRWTRPAPNHYQADAILDDPDASLDRRRDNRFKVESNYSLSNVQPTDWFFVEGASNPFTCDTVPGRANGNNGSTGGVYEAVIAGHYEAPAAYLWMLEKQAYEDFSALPASIQTTAMQTFLTSKHRLPFYLKMESPLYETNICIFISFK